ncbi:26S proteasome non-ATPase regulatory subunit 10-like [Harmonia axyridis]|uniref:26S proteasome non-ATPase regulatory subunit 10-like n=1 Tax=Harmonia axyridis TaxID=115357 RepID=UPI001E2775BC|nr:26S proteasome non-ATPase regulatory subunit 10-like [Harmonia axyridis]
MSQQTSIFESAHKGDFDVVRNKLEEDPTLLNKQDENKRILLHWACVGGNVKLVTHLIELGSPVDALDDTDNSPLILSSSAGHYEVVCLLIKNRCNVNQKTSGGHSALQYAASKGWLEICRKLLENQADINIADVRSATPLHRAASKGNTNIVEFLLTFEDLDVDPRDSYGNTPLHLACEEDRQREAKLLVDHGASLDVRNAEKKTPLDFCSRALFRLLTNK